MDSQPGENNGCSALWWFGRRGGYRFAASRTVCGCWCLLTLFGICADNPSHRNQKSASWSVRLTASRNVYRLKEEKSSQVIHEALFAPPVCSFLHASHHPRGFYTQQQVVVGEHGKGWLGWLKMYFYSLRTCRRCIVAAAGVLHTFGRFFLQTLSALFFFFFYTRSKNRFCLILTSLWWVANV